jgi:ApbE superfamily uncharacterized protein (UPF0280 family)
MAENTAPPHAPSAAKMDQPQAVHFADGRLHLHHGPIDLIIEAFGSGREDGYARANARFQTILEELVADLPALRTDINIGVHIQSKVGKAMALACRPFAPLFVTPMAAVAGAVADEILSAMITAERIDKAYVNNGGDIALHLDEDETFKAAIASEQPGAFQITHADPVRGIATSGWRGRSHSLGIADAVTILAPSTAMADVAATLIANAVNLPDHLAVTREPADDLHPDSDLGARLVTVSVGPLTNAETETALMTGQSLAEKTRQRGLITAAALSLNGAVKIVGDAALLTETPR